MPGSGVPMLEESDYLESISSNAGGNYHFGLNMGSFAPKKWALKVEGFKPTMSTQCD